MKKSLLIVTIVISQLLFVAPSFALFDSHPKIDVKHIEKDIVGHTIQAHTIFQGWTFQENEPKRRNSFESGGEGEIL